MFLSRCPVAALVCTLAAGLVLVMTAHGVSVSARAQNAQPQSSEGVTPASEESRIYETVVVTASARNERLGDTAATVQIIGREEIEQTSASTVTALVAHYGVAFFSQWTPAQTSINLHGASTDGQGKDFRSQVVILINGRRAGTTNISKLSLKDVDRIEIVRGPGSLLYGSQAIGAGVNLITRSGITGSTRSVSLNAGSYGQIDGGGVIAGQNGKVDYALSLPRTLVAVIGGAGLSVAGVAMQGITRNPLVSPHTLGISFRLSPRQSCAPASSSSCPRFAT